jgi:formylglycine-generating enzyme
MQPYQEGDLLLYNNQPFKLFGLDYTELVYVEAGKYIIGDNTSGNDNEKPETEITLKKGYFIGKYVVTQQLYEEVMGMNPSRFTRFKGNYRPVGSLSHDDICEGENSFLAKLNGKLKAGYPDLKATFGLPSEAKWEYAARGGKYWNQPKLTYAGSENLNDVGWYRENSNEQTLPVGLKQPNALGLYDMSGNVYEWCADWYTENYQKIPEDGTPSTKQGPNRVLRGGSFFDHADYSRVARRISGHPTDRDFSFGFRLVFPQFS